MSTAPPLPHIATASRFIGDVEIGRHAMPGMLSTEAIPIGEATESTLGEWVQVASAWESLSQSARRAPVSS